MPMRASDYTYPEKQSKGALPTTGNKGMKTAAQPLTGKKGKKKKKKAKSGEISKMLKDRYAGKSKASGQQY